MDPKKQPYRTWKVEGGVFVPLEGGADISERKDGTVAALKLLESIDTKLTAFAQDLREEFATFHLLLSPANAADLNESIAELDAGKGVRNDLSRARSHLFATTGEIIRLDEIERRIVNLNQRIMKLERAVKLEELSKALQGDVK